MPADIQLEPNNVYVLRFSGILKRSEFGRTQTAAARAIDAGAKPRILAILENFAGWEKGADWNDLDFMLSHGNEIAKIAIVGEPRWEPEALAFADARAALQKLTATVPAAKSLSKGAVAVLVFPKITKAGLVVGGQYGDGVLFKQGKVAGYYNTTGASYGLQAGAQQFG